MCVFMVRSRVKTKGGSEVELAIGKAFPAIAKAQLLEKEGENPLLAISAFQQFQAALKDRLAEVPVGQRLQRAGLNYVVRSEARVDEIIAEAEKAGATILKPAPPCSGAGTAVPSRTPTATSGASATAPRERTSPTRSSRRRELHGEGGRPGVVLCELRHVEAVAPNLRRIAPTLVSSASPIESLACHVCRLPPVTVMTGVGRRGGAMS
jgi:hypothetical protein